MSGTICTTRIKLVVNKHSTSFIETLNRLYPELLKGAGFQVNIMKLIETQEKRDKYKLSTLGLAQYSIPEPQRKLTMKRVFNKHCATHYTLDVYYSWEGPDEAIRWLFRTYLLTGTVFDLNERITLYKVKSYSMGFMVGSEDRSDVILKHRLSYLLAYIKRLRKTSVSLGKAGSDKSGSEISAFLSRLTKKIRSGKVRIPVYVGSYFNVLRSKSILGDVTTINRYNSLSQGARDMLDRVEEMHGEIASWPAPIVNLDNLSELKRSIS